MVVIIVTGTLFLSAPHIPSPDEKAAVVFAVIIFLFTFVSEIDIIMVYRVKSFMALLVALIMQGCIFQMGYRAELGKAEELMEEHPDSAYAIIDNINSLELSSDEALALYGLLRLEVEYRCYKPATLDSLIDFSIRYFEKNKDIQRLARAYFYKGMTTYDSETHDRSLRYIKKAEEHARSLGDNTLNHKIYEGLVMINHKAKCYDMMLEYSKLSLECSRRDGRPYWLAYSLMHMANSYMFLDKDDSARICADKILPLLESLPEKDVAFFYAGVGCVYHTVKDDVKAENFLLKSLEMHPRHMAYDVLGDIYMSNGRYTEADSLWQKAMNTDDEQTKLAVYSSLIDYYGVLGNASAALDMARKRMKLKDEMIERREKVKITEIQLKYDKEVVEKEKYRELSFMLVVLVALLTAFLLFVYYHRRKVRMFHSIIEPIYDKIKKYEKQVFALENSGKNVMKEAERLKEKIDSLYHSLSDRVSRGEMLADEIKAGGTMAAWSNEDTDCFIDYYKVHCYDTIVGWEKEYKNPTPGQLAYLILTDMGYGRDDLMRILGISDSSLRSLRSRLKARKNV